MTTDREIEAAANKIKSCLEYAFKNTHKPYSFEDIAKAALEAAEQARWLPISEAPKDGSIIMVPYSDLSGVQLIRWGVYNEDDTKEGWFLADWSDEAVIDSNDVWMPFAPLPAPRS